VTSTPPPTGPVGVPAEPLLGEPPALAHDPASIQARSTTVRVLGAAASGPTGDDPLGPSTDGIDGPSSSLITPYAGPVTGLVPEQTAPQPTGPARRRRRRRRRRRFAVVTLLVAGAALVAVGVARDSGPTPARGAAPRSRLGTPLLSARRAPEMLARPVALHAAKAKVDPVLARFPSASCVLVTDGDTVVAAASPEAALAPASNTKLITASSALSLLGADTRLSTKVVTAAPPAAGVVTGDLVLVGGGDPLLSTTTATTRMRHGTEPTTSLESLADQVVAAGVRRVEGSVRGDGTRYDDQRTIPTWPARFIAQGTASNLGALMVNDAWTNDPVDPAGTKGAPATDPAQHAASVFTTLLKARGVDVIGSPTVGAAPAGAVELTSMPSLPMSDLVGQMLTFSDNTTAEMLVKEMAAHGGTVGSTDAGIRAMVADLATRGMPTDGLELHDGSGLSRENRATCKLLDALLTADGTQGQIATHLARPGRPGTLDDRFRSGPLTDRIAAKTGTLNDVTALSGWFTTGPGRSLSFSTIENPSGRGVQAGDLAVQGQLLEALIDYPQAPPPEQLGPLPPVPT